MNDMELHIKRFPVFRKGHISSCVKTKSFFPFPGAVVGKGYITFFWFRSMLTVNFNTECIVDVSDPAESVES